MTVLGHPGSAIRTIEMGVNAITEPQAPHRHPRPVFRAPGKTRTGDGGARILARMTGSPSGYSGLQIHPLTSCRAFPDSTLWKSRTRPGISAVSQRHETVRRL